MENISRVIVGKERTIELLMIALLAEGHVLLEDVPGLGKTLIAKAIANSLAAQVEKVSGEETRSYFINIKGPAQETEIRSL